MAGINADSIGTPTGMVSSSHAEVQEHNTDLLAKKVTKMPCYLQIRIEYDGTSNRVKYAGYAQRGVLESEESWLLYFLEYDASDRLDSLTIAADSWDNRATATYS